LKQLTRKRGGSFYRENLNNMQWVLIFPLTVLIFFTFSFDGLIRLYTSS